MDESKFECQGQNDPDGTWSSRHAGAGNKAVFISVPLVYAGNSPKKSQLARSLGLACPLFECLNLADLDS